MLPRAGLRTTSRGGPEAGNGYSEGPLTGGNSLSGGRGGHRRHGPVVQLGVHAALSRRRSRVQIPSGPPPGSDRSRRSSLVPGRVAQLVERAPEKREVRGSMPRPTTSDSPH